MKKVIISTIFSLFFLSSFSQVLKDKSVVNYNGFFNFYYEEAQDKIYLEVKELNKGILIC